MSVLTRLLDVGGHAPAMETSKRTWSHGELCEDAARIAGALAEHGVGPGDIVAVDLGRSAEHVLAWLGIWWCGAAPLPLHRDAPTPTREAASRIACLILTDQPGRHPNLTALPPDAPSTRRPPPHAALDEDLAYVIYTSGTTKAPRAVMIEHRGIEGLLDAQIEAFGLEPGKRACWMLAPSFDASVSDLGCALLSGATLCIPNTAELRPAVLPATLARWRITHVDIPPSALARCDIEALELEAMVVGGEPSAPEVLRRAANKARVVNVYGPTEATVCTHLCPIDPETWDAPLLGRPIADMRHRVDADTGELWLAGPGLARGYLGDPVETRAKFVERDGVRWYRTGDRVEERPDGELVFLGRLDRQFKRHGVRLELGAVERALLAHPEVREAKTRWTGTRLEAVIAPASAPDDASLRDWLCARLVPAALPDHITRVGALETSPHGKLTARPAPEPQDPRERLLCEIIAGALERDQVRPEEDLFALGADSFDVLEISARAAARGVPVSVVALTRRATARGALDLETDAILEEDDVERAEDLRALAAWAPKERAHLHMSLANGDLEAPPRHVLLTGATGRLGRIVWGALQAQGVEITCLARDPARLPPGARGVQGDVSRHNLGLSPATHATLTREVDVVVHLAARVHQLETFEELAATNLEGAREVVRFAATGQPKRVHHASTLSVFVDSDRSVGRAWEDDDLSQTMWVRGGYAQTKWAAEVALQGLPGVWIHRLGLLTAPRVGAHASDDMLSVFLRGVGAIGAIPEATPAAELRVDVTPMDWAADALVAAILCTGPGETLHISSASGVTLERLLAASPHAIERIPLEAWLARVAEHSGEAHLAAHALSRAAEAHAWHALDLFQTTHITFDATRLHARLGMRAPEIEDTWLRRLWEPS